MNGDSGQDSYHEAEAEADDDGVGDGDGGELQVAEVAGEGLRDDVHAEGDDAAEHGRRHDHPQLLGLLPHPPPELVGFLAVDHLPVILLGAAVPVQEADPAGLLVAPSPRSRHGPNSCRLADRSRLLASSFFIVVPLALAVDRCRFAIMI